MFVELIHAVEENGQLKTAKKRNKAWWPPYVGPENRIVRCPDPQFLYVPFLPGTRMEVGQGTGEEWVSAGIAREVPRGPDISLPEDTE